MLIDYLVNNISTQSRRLKLFLLLMNSIFKIHPKEISKTENIHLNCSTEVCTETAKRLNVKSIQNIIIDASITPHQESWLYEGQITATINLTCSVSQEIFAETFLADFNIFLSYDEPINSELDFELIENNNVDVGELAIQYLSLEVPFAPISPKAQTKNPSNATQADTPDWKKALSKIKTNK